MTIPARRLRTIFITHSTNSQQGQIANQNNSGAGKKSGHIKSAEGLLCLLFVSWILAFYLLPDTTFSRFSFGELITKFYAANVVGEYSFLISIVFAITSVGFLSRFRSTTPAAEAAFILYSVIAFYLLIFVNDFRGGKLNVLTNRDEGFAIISAVAAGIYAGCVAQTPLKIITSLSLVSFVQCVYALYYLHAGLNVYLSGNLLRAVGTFEKHNELCLLLVVLFPLTITAALQTHSKLVQSSLICFASTEFAMLVLCWSRGGALAFGVVLVWVVWRLTKSKRISMVAVIIALILVTITCFKRSQSANAASLAQSNVTHIQLWQKGIQTFQQHPITGVGLGRFAAEIPLWIGPSTFKYNLETDPKNIILYFLSEEGIFGGLLLCLIAYSIIVTLRQAAMSPVLIGLEASWLAIIIMGLFDTVLGPSYRPVGNTCFGILITLTASKVRPRMCRIREQK